MGKSEREVETVARDAVPVASETPARQLHGAAMVLSASVLFDSAIEHYRGSFHNIGMYMPLVSSTLNLVASGHGMRAKEADGHVGRTFSYCGAIAIGALGTGFHVYNVGKRVGGFRWENLFYGAPLGAPAALLLSGLAGLAADRIAANEKNGGEATLLGLPAGRVLAGFTSLGLLGTVGEAGLMHFRGNFREPGHVSARHAASRGRGRDGRGRAPGIRPRPRRGEILAGAHLYHGHRGGGISLLRRIARHGRLEKLAAERPRRASNPCAAELFRPRDRRSRCPHHAGTEPTQVSERYPGYNVLDKRNTLSWNEPTRRTVDNRLAVHPGPRFFSEDEWATLSALCARIIPQPKDRAPVPIPAYIDEKLHDNTIDGYRFADMLPQGEAWQAALEALDAEATEKHGAAFIICRPPNGTSCSSKCRKASSKVRSGAACGRTSSSFTACCTM